MNTERLLADYEKISDAPDAISRLRRFILDLAVRGTLVEQDSNDEPAVTLDEAISTEVMLPFDVPKNWQWVRLGALGGVVGGGTPSKARDDYWDGGIPWVSPKDMKIDYLSEAQMTISAAAIADSAARIVPARSVLFVVRGMILAHSFPVAVTRVPVAINQDMKALVLQNTDMADYVLWMLKGMKAEMLKRVRRSSHGTCRIERSNYMDLPVPVPPLGEQHRIVTKVVELMALCDQLEAARTEREATRNRLTVASLARLNALDPDQATFQNHAAFALENLTPLTTRRDQIHAVRHTILNLAVRGKLVPQDPTDEPASEILARISTAKAKRKQETRDARITIAPDANSDSLPFELPDSWCVQSFENLFLFIDYRGRTPKKTNDGVALITAKNIRMGFLNREPREYVSESTYSAWMTRGFPRIGDLFFTTEAPLGNVCLNDIDEPFALAQRVICMQPYADIDTRFLMYGLMSNSMQLLIEEHATGLTAKGIKTAKLKPLPIPIPPRAEQHRIVGRVDALMALCDRLEESLAAGDYTRRRLLDALLHDALAPETVPQVTTVRLRFPTVQNRECEFA